MCAVKIVLRPSFARVLVVALSTKGSLHKRTKRSLRADQVYAERSHKSSTPSPTPTVENKLLATVAFDQHHQIVFVDSAAEMLFGLSAEELFGVELSQLLLDWRDPSVSVAGVREVKRFGNVGQPWGRRTNDFEVTARNVNGATMRLAGSILYGEHGAKYVGTILLYRTEQRQSTRMRLAQSHQELRQLSAALRTIREEERTHISRELHDDLGQLLATLQMDLALLQQSEALSDNAQQLAQVMKSNLALAIGSLKRIATDLRPRALDEGGLYFAINGLRNEFLQRYRISCTLYADESDLQLDDIASTTIFRIVQEGLTNIVRHANAKHVELSMYRLDGDLFISIRDDGHGFPPDGADKSGSLGLIVMRERVWGMRGEIVVKSNEPSGTCIDIVLPVRHHQK